jgi:prophage regulatory protein
MAMKQTATSDTTHQRIPDITADGHRMVRLPEVIKATGLPRSTIYKLMAAGEFPASIRLAPRAMAWRLSEVHAWMTRRAADNRCSYEAKVYGAR